MASIQTSRSTPPDCHSDSAKAAASWVLPDDLSQSCASGAAAGPGKAAGAAARSGTSATAAPAGSAAARSGAVSGLALKPSASAGTVPDRMGQDGRPGPRLPGRGALPGGAAPLTARCARSCRPCIRGMAGPAPAREPDPAHWLHRRRLAELKRPCRSPAGRGRVRLRRRNQLAARLHHRCPSLPIISADRQSPPVTARIRASQARRPSARRAAWLSAGPAHSSWLKTSTGLVLVRVCLRKKAGAVTRMKTKPITPASAASAAMMKIPPICQCRPGTVHVV